MAEDINRISIVIPSYRRESVLLETVDFLLDLDEPALEIVLVDQTPEHSTSTEAALAVLSKSGRIVWLRLPVPSIPAAMNQGLLGALGDIVLFLDDDIRPDADLVAMHRRTHAAQRGGIVAGRVLQPWHSGCWDDENSTRFGFNSPKAREVPDFMGGNFSVDRRAALAIGGFDENFVRVAYRFEAEFAARWRRAGGKIRYEPSALIHHLKASSGGTRVFGDFLRTVMPSHAVGEYYFALVARPDGWIRMFLKRPFRAVATRHHWRRPWWIPVTLIAEFSGMLWALWLFLRGPRLVSASDTDATR